MVEHIHRHYAPGAYGYGDVGGLRHGIGTGERRRLHHDGAGGDALCVRHCVVETHWCRWQRLSRDIHAFISHDARFDAGFGVGPDIGDGQHAAHGVDVIGKRFHDGRLVGSEQCHVVGGDRPCRFLLVGFDVYACQSRGFHIALDNRVGHMIGARFARLEGERHVGGAHGDVRAFGIVYPCQLRGIGRGGVHDLGQIDGHCCVRRGGAADRIYVRRQGVRRTDGEVHGCLGEVPAVGDLQPHRCTAFAHRTGVEHEFAVRACGDRRLVGVLHTGADQGERIAVWVDEAAKRVHGVRGTLFDLGFLRLLLAGWCAVLVAGNRQRHGRP